MATREIYNTVRSLRHLGSAARTATPSVTGVDTSGFGSVGFITNVGAAGITLSGSNYITLQMQESDDNSTFTNVATADALGGAAVVLDANAKADLNYRQDYLGSKRYVRLVPTYTGTHGTGTIIGVTAVMSHATLSPVSHG